MTDETGIEVGLQVPAETSSGCICPGCPEKVPAWWVSGMCYPCASEDCEHGDQAAAAAPAEPVVPAHEIRLAIQAVHVEPGDIVVLKLGDRLTVDDRKTFVETAVAQLKLAGVSSRVLVLDGAVDLAIIRERDKVLAAERLAMAEGVQASPCLHCERTLVFREGVGWIHFGGSRYVVRCGVCNWADSSSAPLTRCGKCGATALRDEHLATPTSVLEEARQVGSI